MGLMQYGAGHCALLQCASSLTNAFEGCNAAILSPFAFIECGNVLCRIWPCSLCRTVELQLLRPAAEGPWGSDSTAPAQAGAEVLSTL